MVIAVLTVACAGLSSAQKNKDKEDPTVRSLQGQVNDPDEKPVAGAVVQLKDTRTLQVRSFITQADGSYRFSGSAGRHGLRDQSRLQRHEQRQQAAEQFRHPQDRDCQSEAEQEI